VAQIGKENFKEIEPYTPSEFLDGKKRLIQNPLLPSIARTYFPDMALDHFIDMAEQINSVAEFQQSVISKAIDSMLTQTSNGLTISGLEDHSPDKKYLYISNHRDIICDPAIFTNALLLHGFGTPKICLGSNLLTSQWIIDLVKMNKGITVKRNLPKRESFKWSQILSALIYRQIVEEIESVWIAQREGRTKDGNDQTHAGVIKMLTLSHKGSFLAQIRNLHVVPVAISYEYDPCDIAKAKEMFIRSTLGTYDKSQQEDVASMVEGLTGFKGRIHIRIGREIDEATIKAEEFSSKSDQTRVIVKAIDQQIHDHYKNWPTNFIAYDMLNPSNAEGRYSTAQKEKFIERMESRLNVLKMRGSERKAVQWNYLEIYATPVRNAFFDHNGFKRD